MKTALHAPSQRTCLLECNVPVSAGSQNPLPGVLHLWKIDQMKRAMAVLLQRQAMLKTERSVNSFACCQLPNLCHDSGLNKGVRPAESPWRSVGGFQASAIWQRQIQLRKTAAASSSPKPRSWTHASTSLGHAGPVGVHQPSRTTRRVCSGNTNGITVHTTSSPSNGPLA